MDSNSIPQSLKALSGTTMGDWYFLESEDVSRRAALRNHMIPLAIQYAGLGHFRVLEYVPHKEGFFIHLDGGSNGYDRADNATRWNAYKPDDQEVRSGPIEDVIEEDKNTGEFENE